MASELDPAVLLRHAGWTRALARRLADDAHLADDLVQEAWLAALERPPDLARPVRGWIASVLRRRRSDVDRARARTAARERSAAREEARPSAHDVVEKASMQRVLVEAVLELDEPYRTTVLLRFFEELPQREIARRMHTTAATVNSRLTRGLARLRERLARHGGRTGWLSGVAPLLREPAGVPASVLGAGAMKTLSIVLVVAASAVAGLLCWSARPEASSRSASASPDPVAATADATGEALPSTRVAPRATPPRSAVEPIAGEAPERADAPPSEAPAALARVVRGRVIDAAGSGVAGIPLRVSAHASDARCTSGAGGAFELALDAPADAIVADDPRYVTVLAGSIGVRAETRPTVVIAPRIRVGGIALDEAGAPLANVAIELRLPQGFGAEWSVPLDYSVPQRWRAQSGGDGRFALDDAPALEGALVRAAVAGFAPAAVEAPLVSTDALELVLARPGPAASLVRGLVLDPSGARVEGARVSAGAEIARTDAEGEFTLDLPPAGHAARLVALQPGWTPAAFEPERDADGRALWPAQVVLQLGRPALTAPALAGRVLDSSGAPIANAKVWLDDPTPFGRTADARLAVESLLREDERFWSYVLTDADGRFSIAGVLQRAYRLQAVDPKSLASVESPPVTAAESPIELRLPTDAVFPRVAGRVLTAAGRPIAGARVRLFRVTYELEHEDGTDNECEESASILTGEDGAFEMRDVPREGVQVLATGDTILGVAASPAEAPDPEAMTLVTTLRLHAQLVLDDPIDRVDRLRVLDADGGRVVLSVFHGGASHASFELPLHDGRSDVFSVGEEADVLVLERAGVEIARVRLHLAPGETQVVRY